MKNMKRFLAVAMAATMVIGSSATAFADDDPYSSVGTGENEGHVDTHVISVTLPTVAAGTTPFSYTIDPERLVTATGGSRYENTFTEDAKTNGVYFLTGTAATDDTYTEASVADQDALDAGTFYVLDDGEYVEADTFDADATYYTKTDGTAASTYYDTKSTALTATSRSSADVNLTVEVAVANGASVNLVDSAPSTDGYTAAEVEDADAFAAGTYYTKDGTTYTEATEYAANTEYYKKSDAELYLALMVDNTTTVLEAGKTATKTVSIAGIDGNFETTYNSTDEKYEYTVKSTLASDWNTSSFYLTGVASKASAEDVTAPQLTVTWKYEDPAAATTVSVPTVSFTNEGLLTINGLSEEYSFVSVSIPYTSNGTTATYSFNTAAATWSPSAPDSESTGNFTCQLNDAWVNLLSGTTTVATLTYSDNTGDEPVNKTATASATFE